MSEVGRPGLVFGAFGDDFVHCVEEGIVLVQPAFYFRRVPPRGRANRDQLGHRSAPARDEDAVSGVRDLSNELGKSCLRVRYGGRFQGRLQQVKMTTLELPRGAKSNPREPKPNCPVKVPAATTRKLPVTVPKPVWFEIANSRKDRENLFGSERKTRATCSVGGERGIRTLDKPFEPIRP